MLQRGIKKMALWAGLLMVLISIVGSPALAKGHEEITLYFVRHGKTMFNTTNQVQGWSDTPLTAVGVQGAEDVAYGLKGVNFSLAFASDMGRAVSTAEIIMKANKNSDLPITELSGLREWFYGGYEGKTNAEMWIPLFEQQGLKYDDNWTQYGELTRRLSDRDIANAIAKNDPMKTAEDYDKIVTRSKAAVQQILKEARAKGARNVLVVAHGGIIPTILEFMKPGSYKGEDIGNSSVTIVRVKGDTVTVDAIGDTSYMKKGKAARENTVVRLYLVRHGKTLFNTTGQVQGWSDTPLTEVGIKGAKDLGRGMTLIPFHQAYASDMGRAVSTARYVIEANRKDKPALRKMSGLREWNYGGYEGKTNAEMWIPIFEQQGLKFDENWTQYGELTRRLSDADIANAIRKNDPLHAAETYDAIVARSRSAIEEIVRESLAAGGGNVLVVAHGGIIPTILETFVPGSYKGEDIANASVSIMEYRNGKFSVVSIGDMSYLKQGIVSALP